jgi:1-acyl-sn-glycerol-3-phosphate acyltransferase
MCKMNFYFSARFTIFTASGCSWVFTERPKVCYKKFLGPDWVADYDWQHCATVVCNHSAFLDSFMHGLVQYPSIVAKKEVKNIPGIGPISIAAQNLHLDRSSKDDKSGILK